MPATSPKISLKSFKGLNNVTDPMRLGVGWLTTANNVNITDTGAIAKRQGYAKVKTGNFSSVYSTQDMQRAYFVVGSDIKTYDGVTVSTLKSSDPMYWTEVNNQVYFNNGTDSGIIMPDNEVLVWRWDVPGKPSYMFDNEDIRLEILISSQSATVLPDGERSSVPKLGMEETSQTQGWQDGIYRAVLTTVLPDGRETGTGEFVEVSCPGGKKATFTGNGRLYYTERDGDVFQNDDGDDLRNAFLDPLPLGTDIVQYWQSRIYAAMYMPADDQTAIWFSEPLGFHLFNLNSNFVLVPGRVHMLAPHDSALLIGTNQRVYAYDGDKLAQIADYGVVPGQHWVLDDSRIIFWSKRGVCAALPFTNLSERQISVAPGIRAGGALVRDGGQKRYVVAIQQGDSPFNSY